MPTLRIAFLVACLVAPSVRAEAPAGAPPAPAAAAGGPSQQGPGTSNRVQVFDDRVFNIDQAPAASAPSVSPGGRYMGDAPNYNSAQQREWKGACAGVRNDVRAYRRCYQEQQARSEAAVRESFERVERNQQGSRLRGGVRPPSPLDYEGPSRAPSSDSARELDRSIGADDRDND